ncbi:MAG: flagellar export chaperone FliS [Thermodesulfobacteriota bacterium]|nr:flagellar export chaperone FliS [Thermodesulfobacteriota bacterium]
MDTSRVRNAYRQSESQADIHPVKLVHIMYERVIMHLELAEEGVRDNDPRKRGENLGKAIAIISELNASIRKDDETEAAEFLRGLYGAILIELPKVSLTEDIKILKQTQTYICRLKEIWEKTAMQENDLSEESREKAHEAPRPAPASGKGYGPQVRLEAANHGVSVSI